MEGLNWLSRGEAKILYVDYSISTNHLQLLHAARREQHQFEDSCIYNLVNLGYTIFTDSFTKEYIDTTKEILKYKNLVTAFISVNSDTQDRVQHVWDSITSVAATPVIEFFETEPAALEWLLSFHNCEK